MIYRLMILFCAVSVSLPARADDDLEKYQNWRVFERSIADQDRADYTDGLSYILSGSIALGSGFVGQGLSSDPIEKGVYSIFQTIGVVAIGYGAYSLEVGSEDHLLYSMLHDTVDLTPRQRSELLRIYAIKKKDRERKERIVKVLTHGLIAALNTYTATQQPKGPVQNGLFFIAGVNVLAAVSYTFTF